MITLNESQQRLIQILADAQWHSGESLGESLGMSRAGVAKYMKRLSELGLSYKTEKGRGYRLSGSISLLDGGRIERALKPCGLSKLSLFPVAESTNQYLSQRAREGESIKGQLCLAELQTQGRGRRGRAWHSPYGANLCLSLGWEFDGGVAVLEGLSLAVGVAVCDALAELGCGDVRLKWPNDLLLNDKKLGGILIELAGDASGECSLVIGLGLNVDMRDDGDSIDQAWTSLLLAGFSIDKTSLALTISKKLFELLAAYPDCGFSAYQARWNRLSAFSGRNVRVQAGDKVTQGRMLGVNEAGAALLDIDGKPRAFIGGELSLRLDQ